jgi:mannose-1-phosphate guanylyltransferase
MYVIILAGGGGTRLRPLSTAELPKPFLPLLGEGSLLSATVERLALAPLGLEPADVTVVVAERHADLVRVQVPAVRVLAEPAGRNTAAAIALAAVAIERDPDEVMLVLPADHAIGQPEAFAEVLHAAEAELARGAFGIESPLVTLGVRPSRPAVEYGYLVPDPATARGPGAGTGHRLPAWRLAAFEEKPTPARAAKLIETPGVAWNAGIFAWRRRAIMAALRHWAPEVLDPIEAGVARGGLEAAYAALGPPTARSIDYAVMQPAAGAGEVVMGAMDVGWSDLGTWPALLEALGAGGIEARIVEPGEVVEAGPLDLVIRRAAGGPCAVAPGAGGTMRPTTSAPVAVLRDARLQSAIVGALLDRCAGWEARS